MGEALRKSPVDELLFASEQRAANFSSTSPPAPQLARHQHSRKPSAHP